MATYTFYDTEGSIALSNVDNDLITLWGSMPAVRWIHLDQNEVLRLQNSNLLEITLRNLSLFANPVITHLIRNFTATELQKRFTVASIPSKESIAFRIAREGNLAKFVFRIHAETIASISANFTTGISISLGVEEGKIRLIIKKKSPSFVLAPAPGGNIAFGVTNPSGGVKIPR